jgi:para-nitrobenzyl esterase
MTDLVASLRWVQENIANFGGDPDKIMIYGQSGGGSKVRCLMGMPSAAGLFYRASVQSGGGGNIPGIEQSRELARQLMKELGLGPNDLASPQKIEWAKLNAAGNAAIAKLSPPRQGMPGPGSAPSPTPRIGWSPTVDGRTVTLRSFYDVAPEISKHVPMLIGNVSEEGNRMSSHPTEAEWHAALARSMGDAKAIALITAMKRAYPEKSIRLLSYGVNGLSARNNVQRMVKLRCD